MNVYLFLTKTIKELKRRPILRYGAFLMIGMLVGAIVGIALITVITGERVKTTVLENFIVEESRQEIKFFDRQGNEILIIDKR